MLHFRSYQNDPRIISHPTNSDAILVHYKKKNRTSITPPSHNSKEASIHNNLSIFCTPPNLVSVFPSLHNHAHPGQKLIGGES
jgi:hypothetical protein